MRQWLTLTAAVALLAATAACSHRSESESSMQGYSGTSTRSSEAGVRGGYNVAPGPDTTHGGSTTQSLGVAPPGVSPPGGGGGGTGSGAGGSGGAGGGAGGGGNR